MIMMPMMQSRWMLDKISVLDENENDIVKLNISLAHFEYNPEAALCNEFGFETPASHSLFIVVDDPLSVRAPVMTDGPLITHELGPGGIHHIVQKLCDSAPFDIEILNMGYHEDVKRRATYVGCKVLKYTYHLNYANSEPCKYPIKFSVKGVRYSDK